MKAYLVTNGKGHWRIVGDTEFNNPKFIKDWSLEEFERGDDATVAYEIDVPVLMPMLDKPIRLDGDDLPKHGPLPD